RYGSQALAEGQRVGHEPDSACGWRCASPSEVAGISAAARNNPEPVITPSAGFGSSGSVRIASPAGFRAPKSVITSLAGFAAPDSVISSLAGFDGLASDAKPKTRWPASAWVEIFGETGRADPR